MSIRYTLTSHTGEALEDLKQQKARALEIIGGTAERYAKQQCPVDTGNLRNSITHQQYDENTEIIGSAVHYAPYVELGTRRHPTPQPFIRPAAENHGSEYRAIIDRELRG